MKILNRIITVVAALAVFPVIISQTFVTIILSVDEESLVYTLANAFLGQDNKLTGNRLGIEKTLVDFFNVIIGKSSSFLNIDLRSFVANLPAELQPLKKYVIASLVFVAIGLLITIVIMGCAIFTKAYKTITCLGLGGAVSFLVSIILFGKVAKPFLDGSIDVVSIFGPMLVSKESTLGSVALSALNGTVKFDTFGLGGAVFGAMFILFGIAIWEFSYYITLPKSEKELLKSSSSKKIKHGKV